MANILVISYITTCLTICLVNLSLAKSASIADQKFEEIMSRH